MTDAAELASLLREIRDQQREQLAMQSQSLELQRELFALTRGNLDRVERINDRAETIQARASVTGKVALWILIPGITAAVVLLLWASVVETTGL